MFSLTSAKHLIYKKAWRMTKNNIQMGGGFSFHGHFESVYVKYTFTLNDLHYER